MGLPGAIALVAILQIGCATGGASRERAPEPCIPAWRMLFANDAQGGHVAGSRDALLAAVRRGSPLRVAWSEADSKEGWSVEEFSDVGFTNIMGKRDLLVQLANALIQTNYLHVSRAGLKNPVVQFHAVMSTEGRFEALMVDRETGRTVRKLVQRTQMSWYALAPPPSCDKRPMVLREGDHHNEKVDDQKFDISGEKPR